MNRHFLLSLFALFLFFPTPSPAQQYLQKKGIRSAKVKLGITDSRLIDQLMPFIEETGKNARDLLNEQSIKPYMMPVRKVADSEEELSYALATCLEYYVNLDKNYKVNLSPDYISLYLENAGKAVNLKEGYHFLAENGTVSAAILPYGANTITSAVYATKKYKIQNYLHLYRSITTGRQKVFETRKALMRGNPVIVEMKVPSTFRTNRGEQLWEDQKAQEETVPVLVVGFNEQLKAFEVMGFWGNNWGNNGYLWVDYTDFSDQATNGYVMIPEENYF